MKCRTSFFLMNTLQRLNCVLMVVRAMTLFMDMIQDLGLFSLLVAKGPNLSAGGKPDRIITSGESLEVGVLDRSSKQYRLRELKGSES